MTEWWLIIAFYWTWFLADCLKCSRHLRFSFSRIGGLRPARARAGQVLGSPPLPTAWQTLAADPPYSFSPEGIASQAVGCAGQTNEPAPVAWRWEEITAVSQRRGRLLINGRDFCAVTAFSDVHGLRRLIDQCGKLPTKDRADFLRARLHDWFRPALLKRRLTAVLLRTRRLAILGAVNFTLAALVTLYLLVDGPALVGDTWAAHIAASLPRVGAAFALIHLTSVVLAWQAHRRLLPKQQEDRVRLILNALLLPPHALRLRAQLTAAAFPPQHPLAWLIAVADPRTLRPFARATLADLRWPVAPHHLTANPLARDIAGWMRAQVAPPIERLLRDAGLEEKSLLAAPAPDGSESCLYCPRCRDQFTRPDARCPRGVPLLALK
jgi:hypothetical protein